MRFLAPARLRPQHSAMNNEIENVQFSAGEVLFEENELSFHFYIIQEGEIEIYKKGTSGNNIILAKVGPGNSVGEFAMLDRQPRSASARALTDISVAKVSPEAYERLLDELPDWAVSVMRALVERLRFTNNIVREIQKSSAGSINVATQNALDFAEFSDSDSRIVRIQQAESEADQSDSNFDFSVYDSSSPKKDAKAVGTTSSTSQKPPGKS